MAELSDEQVRDLIAWTYGKPIEKCRDLLDFAVSELQAWSGRAIKRGADRIIVAEVARATKTFDAAIGLCEGGFGEQAAMLNRSLFEGMAIAHWVSDNRREAVGLFTRHAKFNAVLWREAFDALGWLDPSDSTRWPSLGPKQRAELAALFGPYGTRPWVARNLPTLLQEIEPLWDEEGRKHLWAFHEVPHRHSNQILHSTSTAFGAATTGATSEALHLSIGPSNQLVSAELLSAYWTYGQIFSLVIDVFRLDCRERFRAIYHADSDVFAIT